MPNFTKRTITHFLCGHFLYRISFLREVKLSIIPNVPIFRKFITVERHQGRSTTPNFIHIGQKMWKLGEEFTYARN